MIRRATRFILGDLSRTGRGLLNAYAMFPRGLQVLGRDFLVVLAHVALLFEMGLVMTLLLGIIFGLFGIFSRGGLFMVVIGGVLIGPAIWLLGRTSGMIQQLNDWMPSVPIVAAWGPTSPLWDRELDGAAGLDPGLFP